MAIAQNPSFRIILSGDNITAVDSSTSFTLGQKVEIINSIKDTDGDVAIELSLIDDIEVLAFYSTGAFNVKFDSNVIAVSAGWLTLQTTQTWLDTITTIAINTATTTDIDVYVYAYGNDA
jgi:hypothetical protein